MHAGLQKRRAKRLEGLIINPLRAPSLWFSRKIMASLVSGGLGPELFKAKLETYFAARKSYVRVIRTVIS